jgi:tRNA U54 and U55 pseudouridine synthase Pus10
MTVEGVRAALRERIARGATLEELETLVQMTRGLGERQRAALLGEAHRYDPRQATLRRVEGVRSALSRIRQV